MAINGEGHCMIYTCRFN